MAELTNRDTFEEEAARGISKLSARMRRELTLLLGDPPDLANIPPEFWQKASDDLQAMLRPILEKAALETATAMLAGLPIGVDWALINQAAADWAAQYTYNLIRGINDTSMQALQRAVQRYYERGQTIGELREAIAKIFGPSRAQAIAVTEVTRAAAQGEFLIAEDIRNQGVDMIAVWRTNADEIVCPICGPLEGKRREEWPFMVSDGPPAHVNCRCWVNHELPEVTQ